MRNSKSLKSRYYVDVGTDPSYPYNCVDVKNNVIVWNFEFEEGSALRAASRWQRNAELAIAGPCGAGGGVS